MDSVCEEQHTTGSVLGYNLWLLSFVHLRLAPASIGKVGAPQRPQNPLACRADSLIYTSHSADLP